MLTPSAIDALPAGPELDARVGEKVMGLAVLGEAHCACPEGDWYVCGSSKDYSGDYGAIRPVYLRKCFCDKRDPETPLEYDPVIVGHRAVCLEPVPCYSTSIETAWNVIKRLELVPISLSSRIGDSWRLVKTFQGAIRLDMITPAGIVEGPEADTAPFAICRAALKAVGCTPT